MKKTGRPTKFLPQYVVDAEKYAAIGLPLKDMAYIWGVDVNTVTNWHKKHLTFSDALKKGESRKRASLLASLFRNATQSNNVAAQIFLAKNWLGMSDRQDLSLMPAADEDGKGVLTIEVVRTRNGNGKGKGNGDGGGNGNG